jgi:hypothetical protein
MNRHRPATASSAKRLSARFVLCALLASAALLLIAGTAQAADGVRLFTNSNPLVNDSQSDPATSGQMLVFADSAPDPLGGANLWARIWAFNLTTRIGWDISPTIIKGPQSAPNVCVANGVVYAVWVSADTLSGPGTDYDIWLWQGDTAGTAAAGTWPMKLVTGPPSTDQTAPSIGVVVYPDGAHVVVAWQDTRDHSALAPLIHMLDLSRDSDVNGTPDYLEPSFDPATAANTPISASTIAQTDPTVGPKGVFWTDERFAAVGGFKSAIFRYDLTVSPPPAAGVFFKDTADYTDSAAPVATNSGCAWLYVASGWPSLEPSFMNAGATTPQVAAVVTNPTAIATYYVKAMTRVPLAIVAGHGGASDTDSDIFFSDTSTGQTIPVCNVGTTSPNADTKARYSQDQPAITSTTGGTRIVWIDRRQNAAGTPAAVLVTRLYTAIAPKVTMGANHSSISLGGTVTLTSAVTPNLKGWKLSFQRGAKTTDTMHGVTRYKSWTLIKSVYLSRYSKAVCTWRPTRKGTYYVRAWFNGAGASGTIANASPVVKIVVH